MLLALMLAATESCTGLSRLRLPKVTIVGAAVDPASGACRVVGSARPRRNADIRFELWLPAATRWTGRFYQMGNGGFAGSIDRPTLADAARRGDAAAQTDTGHRGTGFDARWAVGRPDLVVDYGYRSIKVTSDVAATVIAAYYGRRATWRYYMGCSNGGRQALVAASRYPRDWDGIVAGAPAADWSHQLERFATIQHAIRDRPGGWGDPARILGGGATPAQAAAVATIEQAGYPADRASAREWRRWIYNPDPAAPSQRTFAEQAFRFLFRHDPDWTTARYARVRDAPDGKTRATLDVGPLDRFVRRGGRILSYFGWSDAVLSPGAGVAFHDRQVARLRRAGLPSASYRLFMVPGMAHCQGGDAPHGLGQSLAAPAAVDDAAHDVRRAIEAWVERGHPPGRLIAHDPATGATQTLVPR